MHHKLLTCYTQLAASSAERVISTGRRACLLLLRAIQILNDQRWVTVKDADRMVYRGEALYVFVGPEGIKALRYLEEHESRMLRRAIADTHQRAMDNAMIENGRRVVYWNGAADATSRHLPGTVRS